MKLEERTQYLHWIGVNSLGELLGLGATLGLGIALFSSWEPHTIGGILLQALALTSSGLLEGALVGALQGWALPGRLGIRRSAWIKATILGALLAWALGSLPMMFMAFANRAPASTAAAAEPPGGLMVALEAGLGLAAGAVLSLLQMFVLRRHAARAGWWVAANALAWGMGMPLIFAVIDLAYAAGSTPAAAGIIAAGLALTGALVGTVHGAALVRLSRTARTNTT
ncbi:MAG: hypothetical protein ACYC6L_00415 [Anaerolineae bacterium]